MGYEVTRFQGEVDEDLLCPICGGVLEEPVQASPCLKDYPNLNYNTMFHFFVILWTLCVHFHFRLHTVSMHSAMPV